MDIPRSPYFSVSKWRESSLGNILSMAKGLDYTVDDKIYVWLNVKEIDIKLKGIGMKGFVGSFKTNFKIPNYLGIEKSVSRGFGAVKSME
ncbi:CRISPR-associated endonuclease Cas6 [Clostridium sp. ZS2-4]|uniref:CRISPR-associated endonuclease Cas6 n=1 Tax=Clostridium sp. ZS2-4 TaxID=2987703 RepID=UPI00227CA631|nr:CRISPR-associated endonuclease Cas6 [Clostridium sp. ZS2-4]MCY6354835.1 CRISPR-associated endonuclease Cas6 [Clostridium sp. ZS2-4]